MTTGALLPPRPRRADPGAPARAGRRRAAARTVAPVGAAVAVSLAGGWLLGAPAAHAVPGRYGPWELARAAGIAAYLMLTALVLLGLSLSHPWRRRLGRPASRLRAHRWLAAFLLAFVAAHVVALAGDRYARVGWWGALLPGAAGYRPLPVGLGVLALDAAVVVGLSAALAPVWARRWWRPAHRLAPVVWGLAWLHGLLAGTDAAALRSLYLGSAGLVLAAAASRYLSSRPSRPSRGR